MVLSVDPASVAGYAAQLGRAADDAQECLSYFQRNVAGISPTSGIINPIAWAHIDVQHQVGKMLQHLTTILETSRDELSRAALAYRETDHAAATNLDSTYPPVSRPSNFEYDYGVY